MLSVTILWTAAVYTDEGLKNMVFDNLIIYYVCLILTIGISIGMTCHYKKVRKVPLNYILLTIYTCTHSYLIGAITS